MTEMLTVSVTEQLEPLKTTKTKSGRVRWVNEMNQALADGLADSQWLAAVEADQMAAGREICLDLWPFIHRLPDQIKIVQAKLPADLDSAKLFLNSLADEERHYQELYLKQCDLAGLDRRILLSPDFVTPNATASLTQAMERACQSDVTEGVEAIVCAELAATHFARAAKTAFEQYFDQHAHLYQAQQVEEGLSWLRLHAKLNTRHALWMNRMLVAVSQDGESLTLPPAVKEILQAIFRLWRVSEKTTNLWITDSNSA